MQVTERPPTPPSRPTLARNLGLTLITLYGLGNILGAGIYVLVGEVVGVAGPGAPLAFVIAALAAALTAFTYGELAARYPVSAGEAVYVQHAFHRRWLSTAVGLLIAAAGMLSAATLARGFVGYFQVLVQWPDALLIVAIVVTLGLIAGWGIKASVSIAAALTLIEGGGLVLIVVVAGDNLVALPQRLPEFLMLSNAGSWPGVFAASFLAFFAFIGFEDMVNVAEEVEKPERNLPLGILIALIVSTLLYLPTVLVALLSVPAAELAASKAPLALVYERATHGAPTIIGVIGLLAVINGSLVQIIMASRIFYGMGINGWLPRILSVVHPRTRTPLIATVVVTGTVMALALWFPLITLAEGTSFLILTVFTLVNVALLRLKLREPRVVGVTPCPLWVPATGAVASFGLLCTVVVQS